MPNRFRDNEGRDLRDDYGYRDDYFEGGRSDQRNFNDTANRQTRTPRGFDRGENYFGSGRMGYGDGMQDVQPNHSFGSSWRDSTGYSNYDNPDRRYESTERRAGFGRDAYGIGYGGDWEPEANRRRGRGDYSNYESTDRSKYDRGYNDRGYGRSAYGSNYSNYPSSESGFHEGRADNRNDRNWWDRASDEVSSWFGDEDAERRRQMDRTRGHRGRGPKNYTRSDERIREDINDRLTDHDYLDASNIEVAVQASEVTLTGTVNSRHEKRLAEDIAEDVSGVHNVENRLRIENDQQRLSTSGITTQNTFGTTPADTSQTTSPQTTTGTTGQAKGRSTTT
jgi:osmotically-inducible protein OsmY